MQISTMLTIFVSAMAILSNSQIMVSHPSVQVISPYHPVSVLHQDHVPSYALYTVNQTPPSPPSVPVLPTQSKEQLSKWERMQKRHLLMTQFTLQLNKLMYATAAAERQTCLDEIQKIVTELQSLDARLMDPKSDEKIILVVVPTKTFENWAGLDPKSKPTSNVRIINPFQQTHPFDMKTLMLLSQSQIPASTTQTTPPTPITVPCPPNATSSNQASATPPNPIAQPTVFTTAYQQPIMTSPVAQQPKIIYPMGSPYVPSYAAVSPYKLSQLQYSPYYTSYIVPGSHGLVRTASYPGGSTFVQTNPIFAKSLVALKK